MGTGCSCSTSTATTRVAKLEQRADWHGALPRTTVAATGRGDYGRHLYFAAPRDARSWVMWRNGDDRLEIKAHGAQVVAPPSVHPDTGREYVWLDTSRLADAPAWLLRRPPSVRSTSSLIAHRDPLRRVSAELYVPLLTGRELGRDRKVLCPLHDEDTPSLHVYADERGWYCFGCGRGGSIIDLAAALWGLDTRGRDYIEIRRRVTALLARSEAFA